MAYEDRMVIAMSRSRDAEQEDVVALLVREHATFVYRVAFSVLHDSQDAEDVVQETFIRVMRKTGELPLVRDQRAWLARITWRVALTRLGRTRKRRRVEINLPEGAGVLRTR
jgi:RNA polymerase sigma factor (sigma-70 family)